MAFPPLHDPRSPVSQLFQATDQDFLSAELYFHVALLSAGHLQPQACFFLVRPYGRFKEMDSLLQNPKILLSPLIIQY